MKNQNFFPALAMFTGLSLMLSSQFVIGQTPGSDKNSDKEVKVKIVQKINGDEKTIEKTFSPADKESLKELLKEFDVNLDENELLNDKQIEINIRKTDAEEDQKDVTISLERVIDEDVGFISSEPKAYLGVVPDDIVVDGNAGKGIVVAKVLSESAAAKAGLKEGDLITKVNETEITGSRQFREAIGSFKQGEEITIHYQREGKENSAKAVLGERTTRGFYDLPEWHGKMHPGKFDMEEMKTRPFLGVTPGEFSEESGKKTGVVIGDVMQQSTAKELGLQKGDVIVEINDKPVNTFDELREAVRDAKVGENIKVEWKRDGKGMKATAPLKSKADCKAVCMEKGAMPHCGSMGEKYQYRLKETKEMSKEVIEKTIGHLEKEIENLKEQLQNLSNGTGRELKTEETSVTITIEDVSTNNLDADDLFFAPNPSNGKFSLSFGLPEKGETVIKILDAGNKEVYSETLEKFSGRYDRQIDISENPKGVYFLHITQGGKALNKKIVIQ